MDSSNFTPPARRSMTDEEITTALGNAQADEAGITAAMELLETQAQLRDIEKMEFSAWVIEMERNGSKEALLAVENAKRAQQGLEPLNELPGTAPVQPIEDVVAHLNNLYAKAPQTEPELSPAAEAPVEIELPPAVEAQFEPELPPIQPLPELQPEAIFTANQTESFDEFDRLLAADTVVGAEDELTALEEELAAEVSGAPVSAIEGIEVVEDDPGVVFDAEPAIEPVKLESVPKISRRSRASSQFWAWLGLGGSVLPLGLAWFVSKTEVSFSQSVVAIFLGALASALVISVGALAGKRSGLPTLLLSRAPFGVFANAVPASILTLVRLFWSAAILASVFAFGNDFFAIESRANFAATPNITLLSLALVAIASAVTLAIFGGRVLFRAQQAVGVLGVLVVVVFIAFTAYSFSIQGLLAEPSSSWIDAFGIAVLTFSVFGLAWTSAGADFARKLATTARGASVVGWGVLALVLIPTVVASYGLALFSSTSSTSEKNPQNLIADLGSFVAPWLGYLMAASAMVSIVVVLAMSLYSSNLSLHSIGLKLTPAVAQPIIGVLAVGSAFIGYLYIEDLWSFIADYALIAAVPVAAWSGIFISDVLIRRIAYHEISLSRSYGFYKAINWVNLVGWLFATVIGFGFTYIDQPGFGWTGFIADQLINQSFWSITSFGIVMGFAFASLLPVLFGIPRIKRQEAEVLAIEARRDDLKDIFGLVD